MVTITIFWSAVFCILFFLLGAICKGLVALFHAILSSIGVAVAGVGLGGLAALALFMVYAIIDGIIKEGFLSVLGYIVLLVVEIGIVILLVGWLGAIIVSIVVAIAEWLYDIVSAVLEGAAGLFEKGYIHFLQAIIKRLDKC